MSGTPEIAEAPPRRRTFFADDARRGPPPWPGQRELLGRSVSVDARTAELRERIGVTSRLQLIVSLLLRR